MQSVKGYTVAQRSEKTTFRVILFKITLAIGVFSSLALVGLTKAHAQGSGQAGQNSLLPEIDPQDIEIRGEFTARFPGLSRQPILGFNPTPRVYRIDPQRMPFMESGDQIIANLPVSELARPAAPDTNWYRLPNRHNTWLYGGFGSINTAEVRAMYNKRSDNDAWLADLGYTQSDGHLDDGSGMYRLLGVTLGKEWIKSNGRRSALLVDAIYDEHDQVVAWNSADAEWLSTALSYKANKRTSAVDVTEWSTDVRWTKHRELDGGLDQSENILQANLGLDRDFAASSINTVISLSMDGNIIHQETNNGETETLYYGVTGLGYERLVDYNLQFYAELGAGYASDEVEDAQFVVLPQLDITYWISDQSHVRAFIDSNVDQFSPFQQRQENRLLGLHSRSATEVSYRGGVSYNWAMSTKFSLEVGAAYNRWKNKRYYVSGTPVSGYAGDTALPNYYRAAYEDASEISGWGSLTYRIQPKWAWVSLTGYWNNAELTNGEPIPYYERWGAEFSTSIYPTDDFRIELWSHLKGPRYENQTDTDLDGFLLAGARLEYYVSDQIGLYIKGQNLIDQQYNRWYGYEERPLTLIGGITARF